MAKKRTTRRTTRQATRLDAAKFDNVLQIGGIRTGALDYPNPHGGSQCRVAHVNTGSGLRYVVALDRGGDIVEAWYNDTNLAYLTPNDYKPPNQACHNGMDWLAGWPGGLLTTCGPIYMGEPRCEDGVEVSLHGTHSNTPASVEAVTNPDPARGRLDMSLVMHICDTRMFGPNIEIRREIRGRLGEPVIELRDVVTNRGDVPCPHALLYHVNFGYPLLDAGARFVLQGETEVICHPAKIRSDAALNRLKQVPQPKQSHAGANETVLVVDVFADRSGNAHVGLVNPKRGVSVELKYPVTELPRLAHWQHFAPRGSYVAALEPYNGSIVGKEKDDHPSAAQSLQPGEVKEYSLTITIRADSQYTRLLKRDGDLSLRRNG